MTVSCYLGKRYTIYGDNVKISLAYHTNCVKSTIFKTAIIVLVLKANYDFCLNFYSYFAKSRFFNAIWGIIMDFLGKLLSKSEVYSDDLGHMNLTKV